ncbi:hypothetical protein CDN98_00025 [Roseateles terrae]|nr:hypothetical protein CDN98_00025 [Roseateles terrae]
MASRITAPPTKVSPATPSRDDHRVFWRLEPEPGEGFDKALSRAASWACGYAERLSAIDDVALSLWCEVHSDTEFAGLSIQSADMMLLGQGGVELLVSMYAEREGADEQ